MAKRLILEKCSAHNITDILEKLRCTGVKAPAGGTVDLEAIILVEDADEARAVQVLAGIGINARTGDGHR